MRGKVLGSYEILDKLGEAGMGEVWRARDRRLERMVALKILPQEVSADPVRRARFEQEARALGAVLERGPLQLRKAIRNWALVWGGPTGWFDYPVSGGAAQEVHGVEQGETVVGWRQDGRSVDVVPNGENTDSLAVSIVEIASGKRSACKTIHPSQPVLKIHDRTD